MADPGLHGGGPAAGGNTPLANPQNGKATPWETPRKELTNMHLKVYILLMTVVPAYRLGGGRG
ncbi:MAG: hypothetical protein Kow0025_24490 [Thermodesulfovibrionales bacterium]